MAGPVSGTLGSVVYNGTIVAETISWSLDIGMETPEVTPQGVAWQEYIAGLRNWTGNVTLNWDMSDGQQAAIQNAILNGAEGSVSFYVNATNFYSGATVLPTSLGVETSVEDKAGLSFDFQGSGPLVYA